MADRLPASFRGVPFYVESSGITAGRRTVTHEYPLRDEPYTEDLGRATREYRFYGFVLGDDCIEQAKALRDALEKPGAATLVHPELGEMQAVAQGGASISFDQSLRVVRFSLAFIEAGLNAFPSTGSATQSLSRMSADGLWEATIAEYQGKAHFQSFPDCVAEKFSTALGNALKKISAADISKVLGMSKKIADLVSDGASFLTGGPKAIGQRVLGALGLSQLATTSAGWQRAAKSLTRLTDSLSGDEKEPSYGSPVKAASSEQIEQNRRAVYALCRRGILAQVVGITTLVGTDLDTTVRAPGVLLDEFAGETDAQQEGATTSSIVSSDPVDAPTVSYDDMAEVQSLVVDALEREMLDAESDEVFFALRQAATAVSQDLTQRADLEARLYTYDAGASLPACVISEELYGTALRASEIGIRNSVRHPLFCPNTLKVLNE